MTINITENDWLLTAQQSDSHIQDIRKILQSGERHRHKEIFNQYALKGGVIYKVTIAGLRWLVAKLARLQIVRTCHHDIGHPGTAKTHELLASKYWFPNMKRFVKKYTKLPKLSLFQIRGRQKARLSSPHREDSRTVPHSSHRSSWPLFAN